ncbi:MAG: hypothetical protein IPG50_28090 [Myxococcales bacterium]|nr:hypothetical protein [Myxococcales bacterium]
MKLSLVAAASTAALFSLVACSSSPSQEGSSSAAPGAAEQPGTPAAPNASGEATGTPPGASSDAGAPVEVEQDAGLITDGGGGNPDDEPDAAVVTVDAGADGGGACGPASGNGASLASACSSGLTFSLGGVVQPGTYDLAGFVLLGTQAYCAAYKASTYSGRLDVASDGQGGFVFGERIVKAGGLALLPNKSFKVTTDSTALKVTQTCGAKIASASWQYSVSTEAGKPVILYTHDSGTATVRYKWVMR